jgi:hypothetical protein
MGVDTHGKPPAEGRFYIHVDASKDCSGATVCILREGANLLVVRQIVEDRDSDQIPLAEHNRILREFDDRVARPAAESFGGMTFFEIEAQTLADHFSGPTLRLLDAFLHAGNAAGPSAHPSDEKNWIAFLISAHRTAPGMHCDAFKALLQRKVSLPDDAVVRLSGEFDFAMRLLRQFDSTN